MVVPSDIGIRRRVASIAFNWEDPLAAAELYTEEELAVQDTARQFSQERLLPRVLGVYMYKILLGCKTEAD